jgi:hypothetical protein
MKPVDTAPRKTALHTGNQTTRQARIKHTPTIPNSHISQTPQHSRKAGSQTSYPTNRGFPQPPKPSHSNQQIRTTDLQTILKDPALISALSSQHPSYTARQQHLETLIKSNKDLATRLLEMQNHLAEVRASTETMLITHQSLEVSWRKKQAEMDAALAPWSPKALYQRFSAAITEQEAVCHAVEESFLDEDHHGRATEKEIADWVRRVRAEASKLAARKEAKARWDEGRVGGWR